MSTNNFADKSQLAQQKLIQLLETGENEQIEFKRVNNSNYRMTITEISDLHLKTFNTSWDHYPDPYHKLDDISLDKVNNFIDLSNMT